MKDKKPVLKINSLNLWINKHQILKDINLSISKNQVTAIMGPSGCGKTTLIRCINRLSELIPGIKITGEMKLYNQDLLALNPILVRKKIGMVFQRPNPFPNMSIYENVLSGYTLNAIKLSKQEKNEIAEDVLTKAGLWGEVKDSLHRKGTFLSGGQQQRLCIARALALKPSILLLDEPTSALDPKATIRIEDLISELKKTVTIMMVTHNIAQASRISDFTAFLYLGKLIEFDKTKTIFTEPKEKLTEEYLTRKFG